MKRLLSILLIVCAMTLCLVSCGEEPVAETGIKLSKQQVENAYESINGTLTVEGSSSNVSSFTFVISGIDTSDFNYTYVKNAVYTLLENPGKITLGQLDACNAFNAVMAATGLFRDESDEFDYNEYIDEIVSTICFGISRIYDNGNWRVTTESNESTKTFTVKVEKGSFSNSNIA